MRRRVQLGLVQRVDGRAAVSADSADERRRSAGERLRRHPRFDAFVPLRRRLQREGARVPQGRSETVADDGPEHHRGEVVR